ncbi:transcriptional regulator [Lachnospiraceae bacterium RM5]|nr:transcriptional regulator [Lachnospiraceae bacterium RM5]
MKTLSELSKDELLELKKNLEKEYNDEKSKGISLDMSRGKPSAEQLSLSNDMLDIITKESNLNTETGMDIRNYGSLDGINEAKRLMAGILEVDTENIIVCGNASLNVMYDTIARAMIFGVLDSTPWCKLDKVKFLCPVPGYDRHFAICEQFGIEMINIPTNEEGPDMDMIEEYVNNDESVKGVWCVPKFANPSGIVYSDEVVKRFANLKPAAKDFRIFWDNAYCIHDLYYDNKEVKLLNIIDECQKAGNEDIVYEFCSTSKMTFAGAGISAIAASKKNLDSIRKYMSVQTIGFDKANQLRHVRFLKDVENTKNHMKKHAEILRPKFDAVLSVLDSELGGLGIGTWTRPLGGYFISFNALEGCAKDIVAKCKEAGMVLTGAGATYPYKNDPKDSNIRIAPSYPDAEEMKQAAKLFALCVKLVSVDKILSAK